MRAPEGRLNCIALLLSCACLAAAAPARGADLYVTGILGLGPGLADTGGSVDFGGGGGVFSNAGSDMDSSPVYGAAFGLELALADVFPEAWDRPLPDYAMRFELEGTFGRDYELVTDSGTDPYLSRVSSWATLVNYWMDFPVHAGVSKLFGRVPLLEPLSFGVGAGLGLASTSIDSTNNAAFGGTDDFHFIWQGGAGFGYELTDRVTLGFDYRYVNLGSHEFALRTNGNPTPVGNFSADLASHELALGVRLRFYTVPPPNRWGFGGGDR